MNLRRAVVVVPHGFTLMEIVLAIGLTSVVMYLLMTAIELYMVRVDSSRSRVESAQLARTILDQMAADIAAARLYAPQAAAGTGGGAFGGGPSGPGGSGGAGGGTNNGQSGGSSSGGGFNGGGTNSFGGGTSSGSSSSAGGASSGSLPVTDMQGIFGSVKQIRIDRAAYPNWQRAARQVLPEEPATVADMPASVRYYLADGDRQTSQELALQGVTDEELADTHAGLYREIYATATLAGESDPLSTTIRRDGARLELLAPEVVKMEINYFDGAQFVEAWDSFDEGALPAGVEIRLTIYEPSFADSLEEGPQQRITGQPRYKESELVEYRRFVRLPRISPAQPAEALMPVGDGGGQLSSGGSGGQSNNGAGQGADNGRSGGEEGDND